MQQPDLDLALLRTFAAIVDAGGVTAAGRRVGRSQPAITHQVKRLETALGRPVFGPDRRRPTLTRDGEILLDYARSMLRLADEARARFGAPAIAGEVVLGTPDLYAAYLLPEILDRFSRAYPEIEIELRSTRSVHLHGALAREEIDIAVTTGQPDIRGGVRVRTERLAWVAGYGSEPEANDPLPLAVLPAGSVYRQRALEALGSEGRAWAIRSVGDSIAGLQAAVLAGLAVSVFPECALGPGMRRLGREHRLPPLPAVALELHRRKGGLSAAAEQLAAFIAAELATIRPFRPADPGKAGRA